MHFHKITNAYLITNQLSSLPESITRLPHLKTLKLDGNPLESPPIEVAKQGIEKIREYFRQVEEEGVDHLYEAKLLIVGEAGAGKTTLAKKIENRDYVLQKDEASTEGIDVITWHFPLKDGENGRQFRVNVWDFGGQEIYHATHQFFLTKRSLYALVADTRKENTDFYYWLNVVELLADDSPLLIIKNEKQDRQREINDRQLRAEFDNLKGTFATNLATNRGLDEVLDEIQHYIRKLPHVGSRLPKTWVKVRDALERDERHYITLAEYLALCDTHGFKRHEDKLQLSGYLHDLGVCLHFQDDPVLRHSVIIKPEWATDAVYRVLDDQTVINNQGKFSKTELANIWHEQKYATMHDELLQLMLKFQLCYRIEHTDWYIAPQLLSLKQPTYQWDEHDNLLLRYQYPFMPKGIITRFIVAMHDYIWQQHYVWRSGVILQDKQTKTKAEVIEHYSKREINVRVVGQQKKELMRLVRHELERIHRSFKRLKYQTLVPCDCERCAGQQDPHFYDYNLLNEYRSQDIKEIRCGKHVVNLVNVRSLIDDVELIMADERRKEGDIGHIGRDQIKIEVYGGQMSFNKADNSEIVQEIKQDNPVTSPPEEKGEANKLFFFYLALSVLGFLGNLFTVFDLTACQKLWSRLAFTILALLCGLLLPLWNKPQRSTRVRIGEFVLVILITLSFGWLTYQSYQANAANNCFDIGLNTLKMAI